MIFFKHSGDFRRSSWRKLYLFLNFCYLLRRWLHDPGLLGWNFIRPTGTDFILLLHEEIKFRLGKAGQFSTWHLSRFACIFFEFFFVSISVYQIENIYIDLNIFRLSCLVFSCVYTFLSKKKQSFLKVLQYSQKNTGVEFLFNEIADLKACKDTLVQMFSCEY